MPTHSDGSIRDREIKELAKQSPQAAYTLMVQSYFSALNSYVSLIVKNREDAYDIVVDTFVRAMREVRLFDSEFHTRAWLYRVALNLSLNFLRDKERRGKLLEMHFSDLLPTRPPDGEEYVSANERRSHFDALLAQLTPDHQEILRLRYFQGLSYGEIADRIGTPTGTVMSRLSRAHARLRTVMESENSSEELSSLPII